MQIVVATRHNGRRVVRTFRDGVIETESGQHPVRADETAAAYLKAREAAGAEILDVRSEGSDA